MEAAPICVVLQSCTAAAEGYSAPEVLVSSSVRIRLLLSMDGVTVGNAVPLNEASLIRP